MPEAPLVERSQEFFDPWLICGHPSIEALVARAVIAGERTIAAKRTRKRRDRDREAFSRLARALVANAAFAVALGLTPPSVAIPLAKPTGPRSRYDGPALGQIADAFDALAPDLIVLRKGSRKWVASSMQAGEGLLDCIGGLEDFGYGSFRRTGGETIFVHRVARDYALNTRTVVRINYADDAQTNRFRAELGRINAGLEAAQLGFDDPAGLPIDTRKRSLRRIFSTPDDHPRFDLNGRLNGGWWQDVPRIRRHAIRIEGVRVADLDFRTMFLRLAYARAGMPPPDDDDDLYAGIIVGEADEPRWREGLKVVVNAMLMRATKLTRLPKGSAELLPKGCKAPALRAAILERHEPIRGQFEAGIGLSLMRLESDILIAVLLRLLDLGVVALPMHDGLMVRYEEAERAERVMREVSKALTGYELPVRAKGLVVTN